MVNGNIVFLHIGNFIFLGILYVYVLRTRKLIDCHVGMNISMVASGATAFVTGIILIYQFPFEFVLMTIMTTMIGIVVGVLFGCLFGYQTLVTGYVNGLMMGMMAPMIGAAASLNIVFLIFIELIFLFSLALLVLSVKYVQSERRIKVRW